MLNSCEMDEIFEAASRGKTSLHEKETPVDTKLTNYLGPNDVILHSLEIVSQLRKMCEDDRIKRVVGVSRGGLIPATLIAHQLGIKEVHSLAVDSYDAHGVKSAPRIVLPPLVHEGALKIDYGFDTRETLIVDELCDSGDTFSLIKEKFPRAITAALLVKKCSKFVPDYIARVVPSEAWVSFFYEQPWAGAKHEFEFFRGEQVA